MFTSLPTRADSASPESADESVCVVVTTFQDFEYLREAIASCFAQSRPPEEVLLVDDGSATSPEPLLAEFPKVRLLRKPNGGLSSARNFGLQHSRSAYINFLDADDTLTPCALETGLACFRQSPQAGLVFGAHRRIGADGTPLTGRLYQPVGSEAYAELLTGNRIGMHATVLYRRSVLLAAGGFDESLRRCEDYDLYLRLSRKYPVACHKDVVAEYRWHGANMSSDTSQMLAAVLAVHERHRPTEGPNLPFWEQGRQNWTAWYSTGQQAMWEAPQRPFSPLRRVTAKLSRGLRRTLLDRLRGTVLHRAVARLRGTWPPPLGSVRLGDLGSTTPVSQDFGWDRGRPVDRYYIEAFLAANAHDIRGRVLEIADDSYSRQFGGNRIGVQDVLHLDPAHPGATLHGDLTQPGVLPESTFDCIVFTQTLQFIFDLEAAVQHLHAALRPGGVLLLTVPGISQVDRQEWSSHWLWSFTPSAIRGLFSRVFAPGDLRIEAHGNVFAAVALLQGLATEEIDCRKLEIADPAYPVIVTLRAQKGAR